MFRTLRTSNCKKSKYVKLNSPSPWRNTSNWMASVGPCPVLTSGTLSEAQHASHVCNNAWACAKAIMDWHGVQPNHVELYRWYSMIHQNIIKSKCVCVYICWICIHTHIAKCYACLGDTCLRSDAVNNMLAKLAKASSCINVFVFATVFYCMDVDIVAAELVVKLLTGLQKPSKHLCFIVPLMIGYISKQPDRQCNSASCPSINDFGVPKWCPDVATHTQN